MDVTFERKHTNKAGKHEWLTPPYIIKSLGEFDLDPCAPINRPWEIAKNHFTILDDGLSKKWNGRVWCNPPYGKFAAHWLSKCAEHGNAIALTYARTETRMFFNSVWDKADAIFFIKRRLKFHHVSGEQGDAAGAPFVLIAYGENNVNILQNCLLDGKFISLK